MFEPVIKQVLHKSQLPKLLNYRFMLESRALQFTPLDPFFDVFDRKLQQYIEAGLINYNVAKYRQKLEPDKCENCEEPFAVLTLGELEAGFVVCLLPLALSIFVFFFELALPNFST